MILESLYLFIYFCLSVACFSTLPVILVYLFSNVNVCVYLIVLSELPVCMNDGVKLCSTILCIFTCYVAILCCR